MPYGLTNMMSTEKIRHARLTPLITMMRIMLNWKKRASTIKITKPKSGIKIIMPITYIGMAMKTAIAMAMKTVLMGGTKEQLKNMQVNLTFTATNHGLTPAGI